jgi:TonB family protein
MPLAVASAPAAKRKAEAPAKAAARSDASGRAKPSAMPPAPLVAPAPVGGMIALREYVRREATAFDPAVNAVRLTGTVHLRFIVGEDGKVTSLKVTRSLREDYDAEAQRIICDGPAWQPGMPMAAAPRCRWI